MASLEHLRGPQVVDVDYAFQPAGRIDHRQRGNLARFHDVQGASGKFLAIDGDRRAGHAIGGGEAERAVPFPLKETSQVTVGDEAQQALALIHHRGVTRPFLLIS